MGKQQENTFFSESGGVLSSSVIRSCAGAEQVASNIHACMRLCCCAGTDGLPLSAAFQALKLRAGDKDCLVARSKCYLKLGDTENSLKDAEASLQNDKTFSKVNSTNW